MIDETAVAMEQTKICVVGMGYVGLTLALTFSEVGYSVVGVDHREKVVETLREGKSHFFEHGLEELLHRELGKRFIFSTTLNPEATVYLVAVGTPVGDDKLPNLEDLRAAAASIGGVLRRGDTVILRSTVPVGTTRDLVLPELEKASGLVGGKDFHLAFAPERTIEGKALTELRTLPQVVGGLTPTCVQIVAGIFATLSPTIVTMHSLEAAELVKVVNNTYRDVTFAFANEVALLCDRYNLDSHEVVHAANSGYDRARVPLPSPGVGGYCLTKDPHLFVYAARKVGFEPTLIPAARIVNEQMPAHVVSRVAHFAAKVGVPLAGAKVFLLGVACKGHPETSDVRFSPTLDVARALALQGAVVHAYDPRVDAEAITAAGIHPTPTVAEGFADALAVIIMNNNPTFADIPVAEYTEGLARPLLVFDPWKMLPREKIQRLPGVTYANLGFDTI